MEQNGFKITRLGYFLNFHLLLQKKLTITINMLFKTDVGCFMIHVKYSVNTGC